MGCVHGLNSANVSNDQVDRAQGRKRSRARKSFDQINSQGMSEGRTQPPRCLVNVQGLCGRIMGKHRSLTVIMVDAVMTVSMHGPRQIFLEPM
jgi:hypothetical protein